MTEMYSWPLKCRQNTQHLKNKYKCSIKCILLPIILFYGVEVCTAFLHLCRHPGRHQNALLILAAPRHKSVSGKTDPKNAQRKHKSSYYLWSGEIWLEDDSGELLTAEGVRFLNCLVRETGENGGNSKQKLKV